MARMLVVRSAIGMAQWTCMSSCFDNPSCVFSSVHIIRVPLWSILWPQSVRPTVSHVVVLFQYQLFPCLKWEWTSKIWFIMNTTLLCTLDKILADLLLSSISLAGFYAHPSYHSSRDHHYRCKFCSEFVVVLCKMTLILQVIHNFMLTRQAQQILVGLKISVGNSCWLPWQGKIWLCLGDSTLWSIWPKPSFCKKKSNWL